jgi:hypothetical protein
LQGRPPFAPPEHATACCSSFPGGEFTSSAAGDDRGEVLVFSGEDGTVLLDLFGSSAKQGFGPGREAGDMDGDGTPDLVIGSYLSSDGAWRAGKTEVLPGADGSFIRRITSTTRGENFGFDAVGLGDVDGDGGPGPRRERGRRRRRVRDLRRHLRLRRRRDVAFCERRRGVSPYEARCLASSSGLDN